MGNINSGQLTVVQTWTNLMLIGKVAFKIDIQHRSDNTGPLA